MSESTLKRWVDSGKLRARKTLGGHRRIALTDALAFLRATGREIPSLDALGLLASDSAAAPGAARTPEHLARLLLDGSTGAARALVLERFRAGQPLDELLDQLVAPAMAHVGTLWEAGTVDVYEEHLATQRAWRILVELRGLLPSPPAEARLALGGAPEGDPYLLPTLMAELTLAEMGWRTLNLGPDTPLESLRQALGRHSPRLVWISITSHLVRARFFEAFPSLAEAARGAGAALVVGGQALTAALENRLVASAFGRRLAHLKALAATLGP